MEKWIIWTSDSTDFARWSGSEKALFVVVSEKGVMAYSDEIQELSDNPIRVLVVNGGRRPFLGKKMPSTPGWYNDARLWVHIGGVSGEPKDSDWYSFFNDEEDPLPEDVKKALGSIPETKRRAFGSTIDGDYVRKEIAPKVLNALEKNEDPEKFCENLLALLDKAWGVAQKESLNTFELRVVRALFPLYVDSINDEIDGPAKTEREEASRAADREAAWRAGKSNLEFVLLKEKLDIREQEEGLCSTVTDLLKSLDAPDPKTGFDDFRKRFEKLSKDYSCHLGSDPNWKADFSSPFAVGVSP
uniref:Uncharacterized protein n=1 Tax=Candidatus Kentrum sp. DK TaxID=2126562 RepID=A0A450S217_9GAMM|nr:MAG: hypothetical protein BECKDK2373C_GA0170839_101232 [Candidatus Kentron sp. DK]